MEQGVAASECEALMLGAEALSRFQQFDRFLRERQSKIPELSATLACAAKKLSNEPEHVVADSSTPVPKLKDTFPSFSFLAATDRKAAAQARQAHFRTLRRHFDPGLATSVSARAVSFYAFTICLCNLVGRSGFLVARECLNSALRSGKRITKIPLRAWKRSGRNVEGLKARK